MPALAQVGRSPPRAGGSTPPGDLDGCLPLTTLNRIAGAVERKSGLALNIVPRWVDAKRLHRHSECGPQLTSTDEETLLSSPCAHRAAESAPKRVRAGHRLPVSLAEQVAESVTPGGLNPARWTAGWLGPPVATLGGNSLDAFM